MERARLALADQYCGARGLVEFTHDGKSVLVMVRPEFQTEIPQIFMGVRVKIVPWIPNNGPEGGIPIRLAA